MGWFLSQVSSESLILHELPVAINKVIFHVEMSLNTKLLAQSFEILFRTVQTYSGNHIHGFYNLHNFMWFIMVCLSCLHGPDILISKT